MSLYKLAKENEENEEKREKFKKSKKFQTERGTEIETGRLLQNIPMFASSPVGLSGSIGLRQNRDGEDASLKDRLYFGANATLGAPEELGGLRAYIPGARLSVRGNPFRKKKEKRDARITADFVRDHAKGTYRTNPGEYNTGIRGVSYVNSTDPRGLAGNAAVQAARDYMQGEGLGKGQYGFGKGIPGKIVDSLASSRLGASSGKRFNLGEAGDHLHRLKDMIDQAGAGEQQYDEQGNYAGSARVNTPPGTNPYAGMTASEAKKKYRKDAMKHHPDRGGDVEKFKHHASWYNHLDTHGFDKEAMAFFMSFFM